MDGTKQPSSPRPSRIKSSDINACIGGSTRAKHSPIELEENKGISFNYFMACKPKDYNGSFEPKVTMRYIWETVRVH